MEFLNVKETYEYFNTNDLVQFIIKQGVGNVKFLVPMSKITDYGFVRFTSSTDEKDLIICTINEDRFKVDDKYKITLEAENKELYGSEHYYTMDLAKLIKDDYIKIIQTNYKQMDPSISK